MHNTRIFLGVALLVIAVVSPSPARSPQSQIEHRHPEPDKTGPPGFDLPALESRGRGTALSNWPPAESAPVVDVQHYDLDLAFNPSTGAISGTATITVVWGHPGNNLTLDLRDLSVTAVRSGSGGTLNFSQTSTELDITIVPSPSADDVVTVEVDYNGIPTSGFYVNSVVAYSFTEPDRSRFWFPCRDVPWDKATLTLHGRVPSTRTLVSNGVLESVTVDGSDHIYNWREDHPIATYLIAVAISDYTEVNVASAVTPLGWHVYPSHVTMAQTAFQNLADMMDFYDATLVPYPFDKYTMCESDLGGGMEHQSATLMGEVIVTGGLTYEYITAHELAHQWFGDLVTMADWRNIWLNEGFATFYDAVWHEDFYGTATFDQRMQGFENNVNWWFNNRTDHALYDPPVDRLFSWLVYYKGAWVLRMLRDIMGKAAFDTAITGYLTAHAFGNATTEDLVNAMEAEYGGPLDWFFDQWVYTGTGWIDISYVPIYTQVPSGWKVQLEVTQVQGVPTVFQFPLEVTITTTAGDVTMSDWVYDQHDVLIFDVPDQPLAVSVDPGNKLLGTVSAGVALGIEPSLPGIPLRAWPNPFSESLNVELPSGDGGAMQIYDVRGRSVRTLETEGGIGIWDGRDFSGRPVSPGIYYVKPVGGMQAVRVVRLAR